MGKAEARDVQKGFKVILPFFTHKLKNPIANLKKVSISSSILNFELLANTLKLPKDVRKTQKFQNKKECSWLKSWCRRKNGMRLDVMISGRQRHNGSFLPDINHTEGEENRVMEAQKIMSQ